MLNQFKNLSCYAEFEMRCALTGISKISVLKEIGHKINDYYFFISEDGIFNWFDLNGTHIEDIGILKELKEEYISKNITKCIIPNSVILIEDGAFMGCNSLKGVIIPNSVTNIGFAAFLECTSLEEITIPDNVTNIKVSTFYRCKSLKEINIPDSVRAIDDKVFSNCKSLTSIAIPYNVTSIGNLAFYNCESLKEVIFKGKTLEEVKQMKYYPFGIKNESIFKFS